MYRRRRKKRYFLKLILVSIIIGTALTGWKYHTSINNPVDENDNTPVSFQVKQGQSVKDIAQNLEDKDLISSDAAFYFYTRHHELGENIVAGRFLLTKAMNVPQIIENISNPSQAEAILTIQEGLTIEDIDQKLVDLGLIQAGEFTTATQNFQDWDSYPFLDRAAAKNLKYPLEGYIYPDTYFLDPMNFHPEDLIHLTLNNFQNKIKDLNFTANSHAFHEIITMASIIENEVFGKDDRHLVSGILWKRLENNWFLGADITLIYITNDRKLTAEDLGTDSPYNTRTHKGLPPGPVGNPSIESIEAALNPTDSEYWFYLTTLDTGKVIYARSNEEHNANRAKYL